VLSPARRRPLGIVALAVLSILLTSCVSRTVPPIGADGRPFHPEADERALWARAAKEEQSLLTRARPYDDPLLEDYLQRLLERLVPESVRAGGGLTFKVRVLRDPTVNAFAMPDGHIFVHTGLLSPLVNEAQLAAILAHEITHVIDRHALQASREGRDEQAASSVLGVAAAARVGKTARSRAGSADSAILGDTAGAILGLGLKLAALVSITGHGRTLERAADRGAMEALVRAGYDPAQAPRVFQVLAERSTDGGVMETFFLGNRRRLAERLASVRRLVRTASAAAHSARMTDTDEFRTRMRTVIRDNAYEDVRAGRFALAQRQLDEVLAATPHEAVAHVYYGDLHRLLAQREDSASRKVDHLARARARYERAIDLDAALAEPYRQLGLLYYQQAAPARARAAFEKYLELKPDAPDAPRIRGYILELES
jgi:predicted Zn-dependent protease